MPLETGARLGPYQIVSPLGAGAMGEVYRATHVKLRRDVALKVLPAQFAADPDRLKRFEQEARAASALNHPSIVTIHDIDEHEGTHYIAMELVDGETLRACLNQRRLETSEALDIASQIAQGLARAHGAGIVHRDVKPENVMITRDGRVKILDFGLAKLTAGSMVAGSESATVSRMTLEGVVVGTMPYMSPEQATGQGVGPHSDQFSFGVLLYEMLCGERPFQGDSVGAVLSAILRDTPPPVRARRPETPKELERVVERCLAKGAAQRYPTTEELAEAIGSCVRRYATASKRPRLGNPVVRAAVVLLIAAGGVGMWLWFRDADVRWARRVALPEITRLTEAGDLYEAFRLTRRAETLIPEDAELRGMIDRITLPISVVTEPPGADVYVKGYMTPDAAWEFLGQTPLQGVRIPYALMRWRISKTGFETFEGAPMGTGPFTALASGLRLDPEGARPPGMVRVPGGRFARPDFPAVNLEDFWLDRHEVTNRQFKEFVETGGYNARRYWSEKFLDAEREIPWDEAMTRFRDPTGRPGPSTWELGSYAAGRENHPVGGVSWYEAAAYCKFAGGSLPTIYHWYSATVQDQLSDILTVSNFGSDGPVAVGTRPGLGDYGTYDMAGNLKEWTWNAAGDRHYILGGAWSEPTYMYRLDPDARLPFERLPTHGFRCARFLQPLEAQLLAPLRVRPRRDDKPVSDDVFTAYRRMYAYDKTALAPKVESVDDSSPFWRRETVSFKAAYGDGRAAAHVFLPRDVAPPYQAVVWFPGTDAFFSPSSQSLASTYLFDFIPRSGRALIYPVYNGMYERRRAFSRTGNEWRDMVIMWSKDLGRTLDYLQTRQDMDEGKQAYYGFSLGSNVGPIFTAVDERFRASVLLAGGLMRETAPEIDSINFASRSRTPTLMISGRDDFVMPGESAQRPLFRLLGAPTPDKRHAVLDGGHIPSDRQQIIREVLEWLDRYLGPVPRRQEIPRGF